MTMIDDFSTYIEVYFLGQKSEVPEKIKEYVRHVQTKFGKTPKKIRSDRGEEYTAERLQTFLKHEGIQAELTTPYTPQQNGCAERKNRSLVEMTRCIVIVIVIVNLYSASSGEAPQRHSPPNKTKPSSKK